jgi:hypothetical protein
MPVRKVSKSNPNTRHYNTNGNGVIVKKVTMGRPVRRVFQDNGNLSGLNDIDAYGAEEGDVLVYHESDEKWHAQKLLEKQEINGGQY